MTSSGKPPTAAALLHRALLALMPAFGLAFAAVENHFAWFFTVPAIVFFGVGGVYLKRGWERLNEERP